MSAGSAASSQGIRRLIDLLNRIERVGVSKPDSCLLSDYLQFLADHGLLARESAPRIEELYYQSRYGGSVGDQQLIARTTAELESTLARLSELNASELAELTEKLSSKYSTVRNDTVVLAVPPPAELPTAPSLSSHIEPEQLDDPHARFRERRSSRVVRIWSTVAIGLLLWTFAVLTAAYFGHDQIQKAFTSITSGDSKPARRANPRSRRNSRTGWLNNRRISILADKDAGSRRGRLRLLAEEHLRRDEYAEAFYIYERLVARNPEVPDYKNTLAWILLTPSNGWYRDPVRAIELAEEAVAADPNPAYLDTLAEAVHQNGDSQRAVELEERALASNPELRDLAFLQRQLEKFRKAVESKSAQAAEDSQTPSAN